MPVIETGVGNCHVYVDADADLDMAVDILLNAKTQRPVGLQRRRDAAGARRRRRRLPAARAGGAAPRPGVTVHGDAAVRAYGPTTSWPATEEDWATEYLSLDLAAAVVDSLDDAVAHIRRYGTGAHRGDRHRARRRRRAGSSPLVDAAAVMVNASTRFTDGEEFGFGAEIGISTQKLHARGPMGLPELTSTKYVVTGEGHLRGV